MNSTFDNTIHAPAAALVSVESSVRPRTDSRVTEPDLPPFLNDDDDDEQYSPSSAWRGFGFGAETHGHGLRLDLADLSSFASDSNAGSFAEPSVPPSFDDGMFAELSTLTTVPDAAMMDDSSSDAEQSFHLAFSPYPQWPSAAATTFSGQHVSFASPSSSSPILPRQAQTVDPLALFLPPTGKPQARSHSSDSSNIADFFPHDVRPLCPRCRLDLADPIMTCPPRSWTPSAPWESPASVPARNPSEDGDHSVGLSIILRERSPQIPSDEDTFALLRSQMNSPAASRVQNRVGVRPSPTGVARTPSLSPEVAPVPTANVPVQAASATVHGDVSGSFEQILSQHHSVVEIPPDTDPALFAPMVNPNLLGLGATACYPFTPASVPTYTMPVMLVVPQPVLPVVSAQYMWPVGPYVSSALSYNPRQY